MLLISYVIVWRHWTSTCCRGNTFEHESDPTCYARRSPNVGSMTIKIIMKWKLSNGYPYKWISWAGSWELGTFDFCDAVHRPGLNKMVICGLEINSLGATRKIMRYLKFNVDPPTLIHSQAWHRTMFQNHQPSPPRKWNWSRFCFKGLLMLLGVEEC